MKTGNCSYQKHLSILITIFFVIVTISSSVSGQFSSYNEYNVDYKRTILSYDSLNTFMFVNDEDTWVKTIEKPVGTDLEFKVDVTEARGLYLIVTVVLPQIVEYTGEAEPEPMDVTSNEYGGQNLYWYYSNGGGSRTFYFHATIDQTGSNTSRAVSVLLSPEQSDSDSVQITGLSSNRKPTADAGGPYSGNQGENIIFDGSKSNDPDGSIDRYRWKWTSNSYWTNWSNSPERSHIYNSEGNYNVSLEVEDNDGATDTDITTVNISSDNQNPIADAGGPYTGEKNETIQLNGSNSSDSDGSIISFEWDLDNDGEYDDGFGMKPIHSWPTVGTFPISLKVTDNDSLVDIDETFVTISEDPSDNHAPDKPNRPLGVTSGKIGKQYQYTTMTNDSDGDQLWFKWSWGDGSQSDWLGPYDSGEICEATYAWTEQDSYEIKVKAKDEHGMESDWSDPLVVSMPHPRTQNLIWLFLEHFFHRFLLFEM